MKIKIANRFCVIPNELSNNPNISLRAKGLYGYIQGKPDGWDFSVAKIATQNKEGRDAISMAMNELEKAGYLVRHKVHNDRGYWDIEYILYEKPLTENPLTENPLTENPLTENPLTENPLTENPLTIVNNTLSKKYLSKQDLELGVFLQKTPNTRAKENIFFNYFGGDGAEDDGFSEIAEEVRTIFDFDDDQDRLEIQKFVLYWGEKDKKGKERWQKEKTFELLKRLRRWKLNVQTRKIENKQKNMRGFSMAPDPDLSLIEC